MAEDETRDTQDLETEPGEGGSAAETDWKAMARKWERLAKDNAAKAKSYDELQEASKSELQKAQEAAAKAEKEVEALKADAELRELRRKVAKKAGIPESLVFGADEDEMEANAKAITAFAKPKSAPSTGHAGRFDANGGSGDALAEAKRKLAREIFGSGE